MNYTEYHSLARREGFAPGYDSYQHRPGRGATIGKDGRPVFENIERAKPQVPLAPLIRGALTGWAVLIAEFAIPFILRRNDPNFAPEIGPAATFVLFGFFVSISYLANLAFVSVPAYVLLRRRAPLLRRWQWALCGTVLFLLSLVVWSAVYGIRTKDDLLFWAGLAGSAGAASFYVLSPKRQPRQPG